jgi:uncharacterized protein (TIGR03437 family)
VIRQVTVTIQTSPFPSLPGQPVQIGVYVDPVTAYADPTGEVQLMDGSTDLGTLTLKQAQALTTRTFNESGAHVLQALYSGDFSYCFAAGTKGHQVDHLTPVLTVSASAGNPVTLTAIVSPAPPTGVAAPTGPMQFLEGTKVLAMAPVKDGKVSATLPALTAGAHQIVAALRGDVVWYSVRSSPITVTVPKATTTISLNVNAGIQQTTLTATVSSSSGTPDGSVNFVDSVRNGVLGTATLSGGAAQASVTATQILASVGHEIAAVYSGSANFEASTSSAIGIPVALNAAAGRPGDAAPEEIVSLYGLKLADSTLQASSVPLPDALGGFRVTVKDSAGQSRNAGLYFISPGQINFVVPAGTAAGIAMVSLTGPAGRAPVPDVRVNIASAAPGVFTTSGDGTGLPAAQWVRIRADGSQTTEAVTSAGIRAGGDTIFLVLYGTGSRNGGTVTCTIGGQPASVAYAGAQAESPGLDQVNVRVPAGITGDITVVLSVGGATSNPVTVRLIG